MNTSANPAHTLIFHLSNHAALEDTMGRTVTSSTVAGMDKGIRELAANLLQDELDMEFLAGLPAGLWAIRYRNAERNADTQAEKQDAIHLAAAQLGVELAKEVYGGATYRFARLKVALLPEHPDRAEIPALLEKAPELANQKTEHALKDALENGGLRIFLQPIVSFPDGKVLGFEALARGPTGSPVERADLLFATAARMGQARELETACAWQALNWLDKARQAGKIPAPYWLSINISSLSIKDNALRKALARPDVVVEITEHLPLNNARDLLPLIAELRAGGARLTLDDTGCGFADLQAVETLRPDFIKLCITIIKSLERDPEQVLSDLAATIAHLRTLKIGVLAEGVETAREAQLLAPLDIDYAQGWLYGKALPAEAYETGGC
jgi:EAL domain-containing protein (putative c-di-GMP-specific phosphodiesterase class I)